jgi:hypothetical protein
MLLHCLKEVEGTEDVVLVIDLWIVDRLSDSDEACKVHHRIDRVFVKSPVDRLSIEQVSLYEVLTLNSLAVAFGEVIEDNHFVTLPQELLCAVAPYIPSTACN